MSRKISLEQLSIARPCDQDWDGLRGDDRRRHCERCDKDVHNFVGVPRREAEALLAGSEGNLCVRMLPPRENRWRRAGRAMIWPLAFLALLALLLVGLVRGLQQGSTLHLAYHRVKSLVVGPLQPQIPLAGAVVLGKIVAPISPPPQTDVSE